jgi:hypothetical protein
MNDVESRAIVAPITQTTPSSSAPPSMLPVAAMAARATTLHASAHPQVDIARGVSFRDFAETFVQVAREGWEEVRAVAAAPAQEK